MPGVTPKPDPTQIITPYQQGQLSLGQQRLALESENRRDMAATKQAALDAKNAQVRQTQLKQHQEAVDSAQSVLDSIGRLEDSKGYSQLGTLKGGVLSKAPYTQATDAQAQLDTIAGQIALTTMARLKALSPQGASGFGALSEKELDLLKGALATLKTDISHAQIKSSLGVIKDTMRKVTQMPRPEHKVGDIEGGYRYIGGDRSKPESWEQVR